MLCSWVRVFSNISNVNNAKSSQHSYNTMFYHLKNQCLVVPVQVAKGHHPPNYTLAHRVCSDVRCFLVEKVVCFLIKLKIKKRCWDILCVINHCRFIDYWLISAVHEWTHKGRTGADLTGRAQPQGRESGTVGNGWSKSRKSGSFDI